MDTIENTIAGTVENWLNSFETAINSADRGAVAALFQRDSHWRDLLALSWNIETVSGPAAIAESMCGHAASMAPHSFRIDFNAAQPRTTMRGGQDDVLEAVFTFATKIGPCEGVVRFLADSVGADTAGTDTCKAWTIMTSLAEMTGFEESINNARPTGHANSRDFSGPNWLDRRNISATYEDRDPDVLVVGGGQAGLSIAARLTQLGIDTLVVDQEERIGDNWRKRYHSLVLHNQVHVNHLPYMPFPPNWPTYIPKDKLAGWFEYYAEAMEINFWTETEFAGGRYDESAERWAVDLKQPGGIRNMRPRHIILATSVSGIPNVPQIPTLDRFGGEVIHSSAYTGAEARKDKRVLIIGTGTSAHDMAQDLQSNGATVSLIQRGTTSVLNVEPSAQLPYTLYDEDLTLATKDLIATATPFAPLTAVHQSMAKESTRLDRELLESLENVGFRIDHEDTDGWQFKFMRRGGGYYFNVGCSDLIVDRKVGLIQYDDIETFVAEGVQLRNGDVVAADTVILATGFKGPDALVRHLLGDDVAERVGPIWGFGDGQELRNMWVRTGQPGLWFTAGSFAQCRIFSKYLALQIKACQQGMIEPVRPQI
jgi:cation diffusion facilitator CzcD-associated flavoprotein CzcO